MVQFHLRGRRHRDCHPHRRQAFEVDECYEDNNEATTTLNCE